MDMKLEWSPGVGVGPFKLGMEMSMVLKLADFEDQSTESANGDPIAIFANDELGIMIADDLTDGPGLDSVHADQRLLYQGRNLIGMPLEEFRTLVGSDVVGEVREVRFDDDDVQFIYDFASVGAQVWVKDGLINSVGVLAIEDD
ncbi:MAG: hypothetical protein VYB54_08845 [Pseudomonadota bacterium]|nr:hypothetical protein [Pseudomonadota bacterium]